MKTLLALTLLFAVKSMAAFSLADASFKWNKSSLLVCWGKINVIPAGPLNPVKKLNPQDFTYLNEDDKFAIQKKIQEEFTVDKVGIEFVGWQNCESTKKYDIVLVGIDRIESSYRGPFIPMGLATIGTATLTDSATSKKIKRPRGQPGFVLLKKTQSEESIPTSMNSDDKLLFTALHEFGHSAALRHEHAQSGGVKDPNCSKRYMIISDAVRENNKTAQAYGRYDSHSIMNYCYVHIVNYIKPISAHEIKFSEGDIHALRCLYLKDQEPIGSCEPVEISKPKIKK